MLTEMQSLAKDRPQQLAFGLSFVLIEAIFERTKV
jgi:hypothetical protein